MAAPWAFWHGHDEWVFDDGEMSRVSKYFACESDAQSMAANMHECMLIVTKEICALIYAFTQEICALINRSRPWLECFIDDARIWHAKCLKK